MGQNAHKCPKCGREARCLYLGDIGLLDYVDLYLLECSHCGRIERQQQHGGHMYSEAITRCPFCGVVYNKHPGYSG